MIIFKYKKEVSRNKSKHIQRPIADVFLKNKSGGWIEFHPYIDSGADVTLIPLSLGRLIGLRLDENKVEQIGGVELNVHIAWALIEEVPPLLGRADIFDYFHVTFKQDQGIILFNKI